MQYTLARDCDGCRTRFEAEKTEVGDWTVPIDEELDRIPVVSGEERIGFVWGTVLDPEAVVSHGTKIEVDPRQPTTRAFERELYRLAGRYVGMLISDEHERLYLDPGGFLPAVYRTDGDVREVASSPAMLDIDYDERFRAGFFERCRKGDAIWLPGRQTYHDDVTRLLPNHYLDLETWETHRHWPREGDLPTDHDIDTAADIILSNTRNIIDCAVKRYDRLYSSLTAGCDSRLLLATSRDHSRAGDVLYFMFGPEERLDEDFHTARRIAEDANLDWEGVPRVRATETEREQWLRTTGHAVGGAIMRIHPTLATIPGDARLVGLGGEIGRGFYWKESDTSATTLTPTGLLDRMHRSNEPELVEELSAWLDEITDHDLHATLNLAYQELRLGCWAGPQQLGSAPLIDLFGPLCYRSSIEAMHALPTEVHGADSAVPYMVERQWPSLTGYPFNEFDDYRKYERLARRALGNPRGAIRWGLGTFGFPVSNRT
jgi:hypothetical protein